MTNVLDSAYTKIKSSIYLQLISKITLVMLFYSLFRFFFYIMNSDFFEEMSLSDFMTIMKGGLLFDISAVLYTNLLIIVLSIIPFKFKYKKGYQSVLNIIFYVVNIACFVMNAMDIVYYRYTLRRTTFSIFNEFGNNGNIDQIFIKGIVDFWPVTMVSVGMILAFVYMNRKLPKPSLTKDTKWLFYIGQILLIPLFLGLTVAGLRGGFTGSTRPITLSNAAKYINNGKERAMVLNTPFALIRTAGKRNLKKPNYFSQQEISNIYNVTHKASVGDSTFKQPNIVILILESFGRGHVGYFNKDLPNYKSYTPFLDSLCNHSLVYKNTFANGQKSIDALPSIIASIPSIQEPFVLSTYSGNSINSMASILKQQNYTTAFFHGAPNGSMGFDSFVKQAGYDSYYGKREFNDNSQFDGIWGIWDEPFMQYYANTLSTFKEPFLGTLFSLSSHHPFKIPEKYKDVFPEGEVPLQKCIMYTDNAIRQFFNNCKQQDWYNNTIFVITSDHGTFTPIPKYKTSSGDFSIPLIFYAPGIDNFKGYNDSIYVQQIDIMPTILNMVGTDKDYIAFGTDILNPNKNHFAFNYTGGFFQLIKDDYVILFDGKESHSMYNIANDPLQKTNIINDEPEIANKLEQLVKAMVQEYSDRLIDNKLTIN